MMMITALLFLTITTVDALPLANVHVKFISPPNVYEHSITTDGDRTLAQNSFISIGRKSTTKRSKDLDHTYRPNLRRNYLRQMVPVINNGNVESLWPAGVFLSPVDVNEYNWYETQHNYPYKSQVAGQDSYLLTGHEAMIAVKYIYGLGELFFDNYPHITALLRHQEERMLNGLHGHVLSSLNPKSPFYRKGIRTD